MSLLKPFGVAVDDHENIYVTDGYRKNVYIFNFATKEVGELFNPLGWKMPTEVAVDNKNDLIAVTNDSLVHLFDMNSRKLIVTVGAKRGAEDFQRSSGVAFDPDRKVLYVADAKKSGIYAYGYDGKKIATIAERGSKGENVYFPTGLAVDSDGRLYVVDTMNFRVVIFNPDGSLYRVFGEHGDKPGQFARPKGIGVSKDGLIFVTDASFSNFQIFDSEGNVYLFVGGYGRGPGTFRTPAGLYVDHNDKIYVVDQSNRRVQVFQLYSDSYYAEHPEEAAKYKKAPEKLKPIVAQENPPSQEEKVDTPEEVKAHPEEDMEEGIPTPEELEELGW